MGSGTIRYESSVVAVSWERAQSIAFADRLPEIRVPPRSGARLSQRTCTAIRVFALPSDVIPPNKGYRPCDAVAREQFFAGTCEYPQRRKGEST